MISIDKLPPGVWPVMLTPFLDNNNLDVDGLRRLTDFYLSAGVNGLFANCLSSEMYQLNQEERLTVVRTVVSQCQGRVPVVATGSFSQDVDRTADFIKQVYDQGVAAVILISGVLVDLEEGENLLKGRLEKIMKKTGDIPLGVYECPVPYKRLISPSLMSWLAASGRFLYHKDTSCNAASIREKLAAIQNSHFSLFNADTPTALDSLRDGARGISPISGNFYPELFTYLYSQFTQKGMSEELNHLYNQLIVMDKVNHYFYPYAAKLFLQARGVKISTRTRIPTEVMAAADKVRLKAVLEMYEKLSSQYGVEGALQNC
jgi:4-hydroxy-tetrahydrodipicolinate synthase